MSGKIAAALLAASAWLVAGQDSSAISGVVRGLQGAAVVGALVTAHGTDSGPVVKAVTDVKGTYSLLGLRAGSYTIVVAAPGFAAAKKQVSVGTSADFDLTATPEPPKFEAAGVRGLIDPGGYSVPAAAASASTLVTGMADIQRQNNVSGKDWPCSLEPKLKQAVDSASAEAELQLGEFYLAHGQFQEAYLRLKMASEKRPEARSLDLLAQAYEGSGMFGDAARAYQASARIKPSEDSLFGAGYELILNGSAELAATSFREGLGLRPESFKLWIGSGAAEFLAGRPDAAVKAFLRAIGLKPDEPIGYEYLAKAFAGGGADPIVNAAFRHFVEIAPQNAKAYYYYALSLRRQNSSDSQIEVLLKRSIALDPGFADAHFELGTWYAAKSDTPNVIAEYEKTVKLTPGLAQAHYRLAQAYKLAGEPQKASQELAAFEALKDQSKPEIDLKPFVSVLRTATQITCVDVRH